jgi:hypothetical protein
MQHKSPSPDFGAAVKDARFALHWRQSDRPYSSVNGERCVHVKYVIGTSCQMSDILGHSGFLASASSGSGVVFLLCFLAWPGHIGGTMNIMRCFEMSIKNRSVETSACC